MARNPKVTRDRTLKLLVETNLGYKQIGAIVGVTKQRVAQIAQQDGVRYKGEFLVQLEKTRRKSARLAELLKIKRAKARKRLEFVGQIMRLADEGYSFNSMGPILNKSTSGIMKLAQKYGIKSQHKSLNPKYR